MIDLPILFKAINNEIKQTKIVGIVGLQALIGDTQGTNLTTLAKSTILTREIDIHIQYNTRIMFTGKVIMKSNKHFSREFFFPNCAQN